MKGIGSRTWAFAAGLIPSRSTGEEPEHTSREELCVLNAGGSEARLEIRLHYADRDPVGPYRLEVAPGRVRRVRFNDLIDPEAMPLDVPYGAVIRSNAPVIVQISRLDSSGGDSRRIEIPAIPLD